MRWDGQYVVGMDDGEKPSKSTKSSKAAKAKAVPKSESRSRRTKTERFTASCVSGVSVTWLVRHQEKRLVQRFTHGFVLFFYV